MIVIAQVIVFLLIIVVYFYLAVSVPFTVILPFRVIFGFIPKVRASLIKHPEYDVLIYKIPILLTITTYLICHFIFQLWKNSLIYVWSNPLLVGTLYIHSALFLVELSGNTTIPGANSTIRTIFRSILPLATLLLIGFFSPQIITPFMLKWGIVLGFIVAGLDQIIIVFKLPQDIRLFTLTLERYRNIGEQLSKLRALSIALGDSAFEKDISKAVSEIGKLYIQATNAFKVGGAKEADGTILLMELLISDIDRKFQSKEEYWIRGEFKNRLKSLSKEIAIIRKAFSERQIDLDHINELNEKVALLINKLEYENPTSLITEYEPLHDEISELQTALRFHDNVGHEIIKLSAEVKIHLLTHDIANALSLDTARLDTTIKETVVLLEQYNKIDVKTSQDMVKLYREIQNKFVNLTGISNQIQSQLNHYWQNKNFSQGEVRLWIPRACSTQETAKAIILIDWQKLTIDKVNIEIGATLLELHENKNLSVTRSKDPSRSLAPVLFVGKRPRIGSLLIRSEDIEELKSGFSSSVDIIPTSSDLVKDSSLWSVPIGALFLLLFWQLGKDLEVFGPISVALGATVGILLFLIRYISYSRKRVLTVR